MGLVRSSSLNKPRQLEQASNRFTDFARSQMFSRRDCENKLNKVTKKNKTLSEQLKKTTEKSGASLFHSYDSRALADWTETSIWTK